MTGLILASKSASRSAVLAGAGVTFETEDSGVDEDGLKTELLYRRASPRDIAQALARAKALAVSRRRSGVVIGADQTLDLAGALYDKAADVAEAADRLRRFRGRTHQLHAALALAQDGAVIWESVESPSLTMRDFSDAWLESYLATHGRAVLGSVGCYHLEGAGAQMFEAIDGDYFAILGLPLLPLLAKLRELGALDA